jgi:hypothetical protein
MARDFSGVWAVDFENSVMRGPAPKRILMWIKHREPMIIQKILFPNAVGVKERLTFTYDTGAETTNSIGGAVARTHTRWEGNELVIESRMKTPERELHFKDHWLLSEDSETLTMTHRDDDLAGQVAVLKRVPATNVD